MLTYNFPPSSAVGGLRWQKLVGFAAERGWGADVICLAPADVEDADQARLRDLPPHVRLYGVPARDPLLKRVVYGGWHAVRRFVRPRPPSESTGATAAAGTRVASVARSAVEGTPWRFGRRDLARAYFAYNEFASMERWAADAAALARSIVGPEHRVVVSSGPPHLAHVGAAAVARHAALPHVVDLRDPWSQVERISDDFASPLYFKLAAKHERAVLPGASLVATNTAAAHASLGALYPSLADRIVTVMNGSDDDPLPPPRRDRTFVLAYAGTIYLDRDPRPLFRAAAQVVRELALTPDDFSIRFIGDVGNFSGVPIGEMAREAGVADFVQHGPPRPRHEAMRFLADAAMLVSLPQDSDMAIPAKLFEYVRFNAWLLVMAEPESATGRLLAGSAADVVRPTDEPGLAAVLRQRYEQHRAGIVPEPVGADGRFSRRGQAQPLLDRIDALAR